MAPAGSARDTAAMAKQKTPSEDPRNPTAMAETVGTHAKGGRKVHPGNAGKKSERGENFKHVHHHMKRCEAGALVLRRCCAQSRCQDYALFPGGS